MDVIDQYNSIYGNIFSFFTSPVFLIITTVIFLGGFILIYIIKYFTTISMIKRAIKEALREYDLDKSKKGIVIEPEKKDSKQ